MRLLSAVVGCFLFALPTLAQEPQTGIPPFSSTQSLGLDTINQQNLNINFAIPIASSPGRGVSFNFPIVNDSLLWQKSSNTWKPVVDAAGNPTWGWKTALPAGTSRYSHATQVCDSPPPIQSSPEYFGYSYTDPAGTVHKFNLDFYLVATICDFPTGPRTGGAIDGSGYRIDATAPAAPIITARDGTVVKGANWTDSNGNFFSATIVNSSETDWTDSAGYIPLKIITGSTSIQYQFPDSSGVYQTTALKLTSTNIKTNFACGVVEYTGTANLPTELDIPTPAGGTLKYFFTYEPTPSNPGFYTGRIQKVTLPGGGYFQYDYPGANDSVNCSDGTTLKVNRTVSDGTNSAVWTFVRNTTNLTTTVTTPQLADTSSANDTVLTFNSTAQETSRKIYSNSPGTALLRTVNTTWAANGTPATQITILEDGSTKAETDTAFDSNGLLGSVTEYDWGTGAHGSTNPLRTTTYTYQTSTNYTSRNLINLVLSKNIKDGNGIIKYRQDTVFDGTAITSCTAGVLQHDDTNYPCSMNYRGNPTSVTIYLTPATPANGITKNFTYDVFGNLLTAQLNCCQTKTWLYSATTHYSQPDSVTRGTSPNQLTSSATYNTYTRQVATSTDENSQVTHYSFDFLRRLTSTVRPDSSQITVGYDDVNFKTTTTSPVDSTHSVKQIVALDPLGRQLTTTLEDASSTVYSIVQGKYNLAGRSYGTSNPYTSTPQYWTTTASDALGRPTTTTFPDNSHTSYSYSTNTTTVTDPAGKQRKSISDAAGRLSSVYEPDVTAGNSLTLQTSYAYTVLDALSTVTQGSQTRTYNYDALGRVQNATIPESNNLQQLSVTYDNFDNVLTRTDARGVVATYSYDGLNRPIGVAYTIPVGSGVSAMPNNICDPTGGTNKTQNVCMYYDQGGAPAFALGRPTKLVDPSGSETYTYNLLGELAQLSKVVGTTTYGTGYAYNLGGELTQITYPSNRIVQQSYDAIGRLCAVGSSGGTCSTGTTYATGYAYNAAQQLTGFNYGNSVTASFGISPDRLQLSSLTYAKSATTLLGLTYSYGTAGSNDGLIAGITDSVDNGRSATYTYDGLARLSTAVTTGSTNYPKWGLSWTYDRYANRTDQNQTFDSPPMNHVIVDATTNRVVTSPYAYDANGNMTNDGANTLVYDGENRTTSATNGSSSGTYTYDGGGLRVKKVSGSTTTVSVFSGSQIIAEYDNGAVPTAPSREYIYSGSTLLAKIDSTGTKYYLRDHLSNRVVTDSSGTVAAQMGHYPYGESWYNASNDKLVFTTYQRDSESGNDYAQARYYVSRLGRFSSVDPLAGDSEDPQSWNRYAYVLNNPCSLVDPLGLDSCTFTIKLNNVANLTNLAIIEGAIETIFQQSSLGQPNSVDVQFVTQGQASYTLDYNNSGVVGGPSGKVTSQYSAEVYANLYPNSSYAPWTNLLLGTVGAHEAGHILGPIDDQFNTGANKNTLMSVDFNPSWGSSIYNGSFPNGLLFTPPQVAKLFKNPKCRKRPGPGGGGSNGNLSGLYLGNVVGEAGYTSSMGWVWFAPNSHTNRRM